MTLRRCIAIGFAAAALGVLGVGTGTTYLELELDEIFERADIAFFGEVADVGTVERDGLPWTVVTFAVEQRFLPEAEETQAEEDSGTVQLAFLGGDLGDASLAVALMPVFQVGERVLVLAYDEPYASPIVGFRQGLWRESGGVLRSELGSALNVTDDELAQDDVGADVQLVLDAIAARYGEAP